MPRYFEFSTRIPKVIVLVGILIMFADCTTVHRDSPIVSDDSNIIDKITLENSGLKNEHIEMIDSYLLLFQNIFNPIYEQCEQIVSSFYSQARTKLWFKISVLFLILGIILSYIKSILGFSSVSKPTVFYNREENVSHADIRQQYANFSKEIGNLTKKIDSIPQSGSVSNQEVRSASSASQGNTEEMRKKIQNITTSINKNEEALDKFHKEKKNIDSFLLDFQKEVIASQTAIWKELHNVKNILSGKPGNINPVTPKQKEKTQDRTPSSQLNMSNEIEKNSPETTRNMDTRPETYRVREEIDAPKHESNTHAHANHQQNQHHKPKHSEDIPGDAPLTSRSQAINNNTPSIQNKPAEKTIQNPPENISNAMNVSQNNTADANKAETKNEEKVEKVETLNTEESQNETVGEKREISPFNRIPPRVGGGMQPFKPGVNTKLPVPGVRKPGPIPGSNPFNKPVIPKPNAQGEGA